MHSVIIVDDEALARKRLSHLLSSDSRFTIIDEAVDGEDAIEKIDSNKPKLVFLDIEMPIFNGFEVLQQLSHQCEIIFVTAYDHYAIRAFEENAFAYLLKPVEPEKLKITLDRVDRILSEKKTKARQKVTDFFLSKIGSTIKFVPKKTIQLIQSKDKYTIAKDQKDEFILDETLTFLETSLPDSFIRIHRSAIINSEFIDHVDRQGNGKYEFYLKNGDVIESSLSYLNEIKLRLGL